MYSSKYQQQQLLFHNLLKNQQTIAQHAMQQVPIFGQPYKTELCVNYEIFGSCKYLDKCQYAHGLYELRSIQRHPKYRTEMCRSFHEFGYCSYGIRCHFLHDNRTESPLSVFSSLSITSITYPNSNDTSFSNNDHQETNSTPEMLSDKKLIPMHILDNEFSIICSTNDLNFRPIHLLNNEYCLLCSKFH